MKPVNCAQKNELRLNHVIYKMFRNDVFDMYKDLALNDLQWLIYHKTKPNNPLKKLTFYHNPARNKDVFMQMTEENPNIWILFLETLRKNLLKKEIIRKTHAFKVGVLFSLNLVDIFRVCVKDLCVNKSL